MNHRASLALIALVTACLVAAPARSEELPLPQEWSTHYAWFLVTNPEYASGSQADEQALTAAHVQYQLRLQAEGRAIAAGGLGDGPGESIIGLTILRAESREEAQAIADGDPAVRAGRLVAWVRAWWVPAERLP